MQGMNIVTSTDSGFIGIAVMVLIGVGVALANWALATFFGPSIRGEVKDRPFECGNLSYGTGGKRFAVKFFLVAILFLVFDLEVVFLYPWAVELKKLVNESGLYAVGVVAPFLALLVAGLVYEFRKGALEWE